LHLNVLEKCEGAGCIGLSSPYEERGFPNDVERSIAFAGKWVRSRYRRLHPGDGLSVCRS